jgi:hypothetical protein
MPSPSHSTTHTRQRWEASSNVGTRGSRSRLGEEILQALPAIGPGLRHDFVVAHLEQVEGGEGDIPADLLSGGQDRVDALGAIAGVELAIDDGPLHGPPDVPEPAEDAVSGQQLAPRPTVERDVRPPSTWLGAR